MIRTSATQKRRANARPKQPLVGSLTGSFNNAVELIRGWTFPKPRPRVSKKARRAPAQPTRPAEANEELRRLSAQHKQLSQEAAHLEAELERVHAVITAGGNPTGKGRPADLGALVERARELRDQLQEKRLVILRVERNIGRERRLRGVPDERLEEPRSPVREARSRAKPAAAVSERRRAVQKALSATSFTDHSERLVVERMADGLLHADPEIRREATTQIASRPRPATALLFIAAEDPSDRVRLAALNGLCGSKHPAATAVFRRFLRDKSSALRLAALRGIATVDARLLSAAELMATLEDADPAVRRAAAALLGWRRGELPAPAGVVSALGFALYDEAEPVRLAAAEALGAVGDGRAVLSLIRALGDASKAVREAAWRSFCSIVPEPPDVQELPPAAQVSALKDWWREARIPEQQGGAAPPTARAAAEIVAELEARAAKAAATPAPKKKSKKEPPAEAAPVEPSSEENGDFENILGDGEADATQLLPLDEEAAAAGIPAEAPDGNEEAFESVLGGDEDGAEEEYENILGDKE